MTTGIKFIETYNHDDFCSQLYDAVKGYEEQGYYVDLKPQVSVEYQHNEFDNTVKGAEHLYTCLVIAYDDAMGIEEDVLEGVADKVGKK